MSIPWQGMPVFFPLLLSPIGIILAFVSIKTNKRCALYGIVLNAIMFPFPFSGLSEGLCFWSLKSIRHYAYTLVFSNLSKEGIKKFQNCLALLYVERGRVRWIGKRMKYKENIGNK